MISEMSKLMVDTGIDWIGHNPDPSRYHLDMLERRKKQSESLRTSAFVINDRKALDQQSVHKRCFRATSHDYGKWLGRVRPTRSLSYMEISGPSARGTIVREFYRTNINSCAAIL